VIGDFEEINVAALAADALEAAEDVGEFDFKETWKAVRTAVSPLAVAKESVVLGAELMKIAVGASDIEPEKRDWRFKDDACESNGIYKRLGQSYLALCKGSKRIVNDDADWKTRERAKFALEITTSALLEAIDAINSITGRRKVNTIGFCAGGIAVLGFARSRNGEAVHRGHRGSVPYRYPDRQFCAYARTF
jgi:hypothetical protein